MLRTSNKVVKKEAVDVFKQVQIYMRDRLSKTSPTQAALDVVSRGWANKDLRDEIFVQLCRQTTHNPKQSVMLTRCSDSLGVFCTQIVFVVIMVNVIIICAIIVIIFIIINIIITMFAGAPYIVRTKKYMI